MGSIEKVMVGGILAIILLILTVAMRGSADLNIGLAAEGSDRTYESPEFSSGPELDGFDSDPLDSNSPKRTASAPPSLGSTPQLKRDLVSSDQDPARDARPTRDLTQPRPTVDENKPVIDPPRATPTVPRTYQIRSGDSFSKIAQEIYGDSRYTPEIQKVNEDVDPRKLRVGQTINLPDPTLLGLAGTGGAEPASPPASTPSGNGGVRTHKVEKDDTLIGISRKYYNSAAEWKAILAANSNLISGPQDLRPGMELRIP